MNRFLALTLLIAFGCSQRSDQATENKSVPTTRNQVFNFEDHVGKDFRIDDVHSYVGFKIRYFGYSPVRGRFDRFRGTLFYDEENPANLSVTVIIDAASINTGNERRDEDLLGTDTWFDVPNFPEIVFQSKTVGLTEENKLAVTGEFTMKGVTKEETILFELPTKISRDWAKNEQVDFFGRTTIDRQAYGVFGGDFWSTIMEDGLTQLSDDVEIELDIHCRRPDYVARYQDADSTDLVVKVVDTIKMNGLDAGLNLIQKLYDQAEITAGRLSSVGYTLNQWKMYEQAHQIFLKRADLFPEAVGSATQLGITNLHMGNREAAINYFQQAIDADSSDTRAIEYLRYLDESEN